MSAPAYTLGEIELARELHAVGVAAARAERTRLGQANSACVPLFGELDEAQKIAWCAIARHVQGKALAPISQPSALNSQLLRP